MSTLLTQIYLTVTGPSEHGGRLAPFNGEYVGTIDVVVLRCYPGAVSNYAETSSADITPPSENSTKSKKPKELEKVTTPTSSDFPSSSSDSDSDSSDSVSGVIGDKLDGADDRPLGYPSTMMFGGDMALDDDPPPRHNSPQKWGAGSSGRKKTNYVPPSQRGSPARKRDNDSWGDSNVSRQHFNEDWRKYSSQIGSQTGRNNSAEPHGEPGRKSKENSPVLSKHTTSPTVATTTRKHNSPQANVPVPAGHASPAIVINVNHAPVSPTSIPPITAPIEPTVGSWDLPEKHSDKGSDENSNESKDSSGSNDGGNRSWGHKKKKSWAMDMPGGWRASNVESQANSTGWEENQESGDQANDEWGNANDKPEQYNDGWDNNEENGARHNNSWGPTTAGAPENKPGWNNYSNNDHRGDTSWGNNNNSNENHNGGIHGNSNWDNTGNGGNSENQGGNGGQQTSGWNWGNAGNEKKDNAQIWGGAFEKKNGWDMPKKNRTESHGQAASDKSNAFPKYPMEFTQSPNNMGGAGQDKSAVPTPWPSNENTVDNAPAQATTLGQ